MPLQMPKGSADYDFNVIDSSFSRCEKRLKREAIRIKQPILISMGLIVIVLISLCFSSFKSSPSSRTLASLKAFYRRTPVLNSKDLHDRFRVSPWPRNVFCSNNSRKSVQQDSYAGLIPIRSFPDGWNDGSETAQHEDFEDHVKAELFFWYFPPPKHVKPDAPLIIWLQGGPGSTGLIGLFHEMGPYRLNAVENCLLNNLDAWSNDSAMLFVDNPVGTGFSRVDKGPHIKNSRSSVIEAAEEGIRHGLNPEEIQSKMEHVIMNMKRPWYRNVTDKFSADSKPVDWEKPRYNEGYVQNQAAVSRDFYIFLQKFYEYFPEALQRPLYIAGESYGGKYVPAIAFNIYEKNKSLIKHNFTTVSPLAPFLVPLRGIAVGNGLIDPKTQVKSHTPMALSLGLVSTKQAEQMARDTDAAIYWSHQEEWMLSLSYRLRVFDTFLNATGGLSYYDLRKFGKNNWSQIEKFVTQPLIKRSLNIRDEVMFFKDPLVYANLAEDIMKSTANIFPILLDEARIKVLLYQGNFDFRDGALSHMEWLEKMPWSGREQYLANDREIWTVPDTNSPCGTIQKAGLLRQVVIFGAGHLAPADQTKTSREMINRFLLE